MGKLKMNRSKSENNKAINPKRAIFAFCDEPNSNLFKDLTTIYKNFEITLKKPISNLSPLVIWASDVQKYGVHITLRGVAPVQKTKVNEWFDVIEKITNQFAPINIEGTYLSKGFPRRIVLNFKGPHSELSRLNSLSISLSNAISYLLDWTPISIDEFHLTKKNIELSNDKNKKLLLRNMEEIFTKMNNRTLLPLTNTPEYRMSLLVNLWKNKQMVDALFKVGDPFSIYLKPHLSILANVDLSQNIMDIVKKLKKQFSHLEGQSVQLKQIYAMVESRDSFVTTITRDNKSGIIKKIQSPKWIIEKSFKLSGTK
jgi:hypothetical protein